MRLIGLFLFLILFPLFSGAQENYIRTDDIRKVYISPTGLYKKNSNKTTSIYLSEESLKGYEYITVQANKEHGTRVHILKKEPKGQEEKVQYSDFYNDNMVVSKGRKLDIVIPKDAKCIYILNSAAGENYKPDNIFLYKADSLSISLISEEQIRSRRSVSEEFLKFMHWNIGHFSKGKYPYSTIKNENYKVKLESFKTFINAYCADCQYLLNEYDETFARVDGRSIKTSTVLFDIRKGYKVFPRTTSSAYSELAIFWKEGLQSYTYGVFESLKGVKNRNGTLEYGTGYCILQYNVAGKNLYVMSLHAPNGIKKEEQDALYREILSLCSNYDNCVIVGDLNRTARSHFAVLTNAGFKILNDNSITYPTKSKGNILDWVLYKCKDITLTDFKVYTEAVDSSGDLLSDHLPLSFTVTSKR